MSLQKPSVSEASVIKDFITKAIALRYFYIAILSLLMVRAYLVNKYSPTQYQNKSVIGPMEDTRSTLLGSNNLFPGFNALDETRNLENDVNNLHSFSLVSTTINNLNLEVGYFTEKTKLFKQRRQMYPNSLYTVNLDKSHIQPINSRFYIEILDNGTYRLTSSAEEVILYNYIDNVVVGERDVLKIDTICKFNETIVYPDFKFSVSLNGVFNENINQEDEVSYFEFYHIDYLTMDYLGRLKVEPVNLKSSLINVYFEGQNINLTIDFLNKYIQNYLDDNLSKKNKISINAINFIDGQLSDISDSLSQSETQLKDYRSANQVMDLSYQGQRAFEQMSQIDNDRTNLQMQERYYTYILEYFNQNKDMAGLAPPSAANVADPILNQMIMDLLTLNAQRSNIISSNNEKNLFLAQIDNRIKIQKQTIVENVTNNLNTLNLSLNELNYRADKVSRAISKLPRTELNMVSIQRRFNLSDAIYTYLLQKRSESAIAMASNYPDYEILEPAREVSRTVLSPNKTLNWAMALFLGLLIPSAFIIIKNFFNEKITTLYDAEQLLNKPVLATIYNNPHKYEAVVAEHPGSSVAESFRNYSFIFVRIIIYCC